MEQASEAEKRAIKGPPPRLSRFLKRAIVFLTVLYVAWGTALWLLQRSLIFPASMVPATAILDALPPSAEPFVTGADSPEALGWLFRPTNNLVGEKPGRRFPLAIWFHGNAEIIDQLWDSREVEWLRDEGFALLLIEYPGYGRMPGLPSQAEIVRSAAALYDAAVARPDIDSAQVIFVGRSLGGGAACALAQERRPAAMILISTFASVASFASGYLVPEFLIEHPFRSDVAITKLDIPILVMHRDADTIVPLEQGRALAKAGKRTRLVIQPGAGHLDFPTDWMAFQNAVESFLCHAGLTEQ